VESSATLHAPTNTLAFATPVDFEAPPGGLSIRWPDPPLEQERRLHGPKMDAVAAFARANPFDGIVLDSPAPRLGVAATGKAWLDLRQAMEALGLDDEAARRIGLRLYKIGLSWPLEAEGALRFASGLQDVLVVEEKRGFVEDQLVRILYNSDAARRPCIVGKRDERGAPLLPSEGELTPALVAAALLARLRRLGAATPQMEQRLARLEALEQTNQTAGTQRTPFFCSGCPHNSSTRIPEGSRAMAGIGCHGMALYVPSRRTATIAHMGGEGANWIGQAPFTDEPHVFQNMGDGTYTHSGLLALRASAAAGVNITYKILYNDAVAMTGGQPAEGGLTVGQIAHQVAAEGARRVAIVSDAPEKYPPHGYFPGLTTVHHRRDLDAVQRTLRETGGLTVLIYDQTCAAEKRRRRKRGLYPDPPKRLFINAEVCEGCGDCSVQSNCISITPLETPLGRKRKIDQSNCNKDFSCVEGFCPSFVTIEGGRLRRASTEAATPDEVASAPAPTVPALDRPFDILVAGVGGAGVITLGAILAMAAHLEGKSASTLDFTGLSQKNGAVLSHVRLAPGAASAGAARIPAGGADLLIGCDLVVSASAAALSRLRAGVSRAAINTDGPPTAGFVINPDVDLTTDALRAALAEAVGEDRMTLIDAGRIAREHLGDSLAANAFLLGYVWQKGFLPLGQEALSQAIALNGAAVAMNQRAFALGRAVAHKPSDFVAKAEVATVAQDDVDALADRLSTYQDAAYAARFAATVAKVRTAEAQAAPGSVSLTLAVARALCKLMAYKDEYEVARLLTEPAFTQRVGETFEGDYRLRYHLAPPLLARPDQATGRPRKLEFGPWLQPLLRVLARMKPLRGTLFDPFGYTAERRCEVRLAADFEAEILRRCEGLTASGVPNLMDLAAAAQGVRGFGPVKARAMRDFYSRWLAK
jgi:indolepyruvate ferredoxin oxidoreductase